MSQDADVIQLKKRGVKYVSMTWRALSARPYRLESSNGRHRVRSASSRRGPVQARGVDTGPCGDGGGGAAAVEGGSGAPRRERLSGVTFRPSNRALIGRAQMTYLEVGCSYIPCPRGRGGGESTVVECLFSVAPLPGGGESSQAPSAGPQRIVPSAPPPPWLPLSPPPSWLPRRLQPPPPPGPALSV